MHMTKLVSRRRRWLLAGAGAAAVMLAAVLPSAGANASVGARTPAGPAASWHAGGGWKQVWSDNFNGRAGSGVNPAVWEYDTGPGSTFGTGEIETMTSSASNVHLDGHGDLDITALGSGQTWTSGRIQTLRDFGAPAEGEMAVTASIRQPDPAGGLGYWPAFWMLGPGEWPGTGEIDILEDVNALAEHSGTFHCGNLTDVNADGTFGPCHEFNGIGSGLSAAPGSQHGFHSYTVVVDRRNAAAEQIRWYLDGRQFFQVDEDQVDQATWTAAVDHGYSIIFDLAMGGGFPNGVCQCTTPTSATTSGGTMTVRNVTVYDRRR